MPFPAARVRVVTASVVLALAGACVVPVTASAEPGADASGSPVVTRSALGNGLGRLAPGAAPRRQGGLVIDQRKLAIRDDAGRVLVDLAAQEGVPLDDFRSAAEAAGLRITAEAGRILEGYAATTALQDLAALPGAGTLAQVPRPQVFAGSVESQGVALQRVDRVLDRGVDGSGVTVGVLSDSFDTATLTVDGEPLTVRAADDVASGDLPGPGNPLNEQPVVVLEDLEDELATDEGRGMLQIVHDMAPGAKLCFATAFTGEIGFANNIRALADEDGPCAADVIVDDVGYFSEPFFSDGIIGDAIDDVAADGVSYFSSAGNAGDQNGWDADLELVGARQARADGLDLSDVDPALYDGGFQDVNEGSGVDTAQTLTLGETGGLFDLQWNDPFDADGAALGDPIFSETGELTDAAPVATLAFTPTAAQVGDTVAFRVDGIPTGTVDLVLAVTAPDGTPLAEVDTGASPEVFATELDQAGTYTITVSGFDGATGPFVAEVLPVLAASRTTTDLNALFFTTDGEFLGALADANRFSGRPIELTVLAGLRRVQVAITRSGTGRTPVTKLRIITQGDLQFTERPDPLAPTIFGHPLAAGAIAVAAQNAFQPYQPEYFTSPGGRLPIYFDSDGDRYREVQRRTKPEVAAADGVNTTFFYEDTELDPDDVTNFFGTSAAAPSAAGIAALVLDRRGGGDSVSPKQMRKLLQRSTFRHDLDPFSASGTAEGLTLSADGAQGSERGSIPGTLNDPRFFELTYRGSGRLRSVTLDGGTAAPSALGPDGTSAGLVFDTRPFDRSAVEGFEGLGFPFTVGRTNGRSASSVQASFDGTAGAAVEGQYRTMTVTFDGGLRSGERIEFGVDRDLALSGYGDASEGNSADLLGGTVFLPQDRVVKDGLRFTATRTDGTTFSGVIRNEIGAGFSPVDGYGLIDAEEAVFGR